MSVCLRGCVSIRGLDHIFLVRSYTSDLHQIFVHVTYGRGSVLLRRRTSGFMDYVILAHKLWLLDVAARLRHTQPWAWRVRIPIAGSGRSGRLLTERAY